MSPLSRPSARHPYLLFLEDHGARVTTPEGQELGLILDAPEGAVRRTQWAEALQRLLPKGASVQACVGLSRLGLHCQETPSMPAREAQEVALRVVAAEQPGAAMLVGHALDPDAEARGGHIHWTAWLPASDLNGWASALEASGMDWVHASAWPRVLLRALPPAPGSARDRVVLALAPQLGRLLFFRGPALILQRNFRLSADLSQEESLELAVEETARTLQFYKQRFRGSVPGDLLVVGASILPEALDARLRAMGLATRCAPEPLEGLLLRGLALERAAHGLDLRPGHVQEAHRRRTLKAILVLAAVALLAAFTLGGGLVHTQEKLLEAEAARVEAELVRRRAEDQGRLRVVAARFPLLRLRAAEQRQAQSTARISRLAATLLSAPPGLEIEKVEIQQHPGQETALAFQVSGTALTGSSFSVGPLAGYVSDLQRLSGLSLDPLKDIRVSDRVVAGETGVQTRALTRFALSGSLR
ncbi:MAG: hypothetical protein Q8K67_14450 [Geothrix sp.]|nr:hypothetical protein [Geothrix sp.]